ncbi:MAG: adenylosuccinate synthase [bacterium]|nr:adenylosuccinate synthase [bacterium]
MPATSVIGLQWGDEAKGKLVDLLTAQFDVVVRYQGGANAGHTVVVGDQTWKLHHIPSGILNEKVMNIVAPGVVINPPTILEEIDGLVERGVDVAKNMKISERAHIVCPWHLAEDRALSDTPADGESIGTTMRGIGPCYRDKVGRHHAVRLGDMFRDDFAQQIATIVEAKNKYLTAIGGTEDPLNAEKIAAEFKVFAERLKPFSSDTTNYLIDALEADKNLLFEGAQGSLLDIDHGTFPFVTSSNSSGVGVCAGSGVPPQWFEKTLGVAKCYSTRVGGGPLPTELEDATGQHIRDEGNEYGTTTGRPRRCGWFDSVAVRYTSRLSGVTGIAFMMLDVLSKLPEIEVCRAYELDGKETRIFPTQADDLRRAKPIYETLPGWETDITGVREYGDLPKNARGYVERLSELVERPISIVSVGPDREQTMFVDQ